MKPLSILARGKGSVVIYYCANIALLPTCYTCKSIPYSHTPDKIFYTMLY